jgi:hypothetical protein
MRKNENKLLRHACVCVCVWCVCVCVCVIKLIAMFTHDLVYICCIVRVNLTLKNTSQHVQTIDRILCICTAVFCFVDGGVLGLWWYRCSEMADRYTLSHVLDSDGIFDGDRVVRNLSDTIWTCCDDGARPFGTISLSDETTRLESPLRSDGANVPRFPRQHHP